MLKSMVKETVSAVASAGVGDLTLSGAVSGFRTFYLAFGSTLDKRFPYTIDDGSLWEIGVGYLSASTTLVRETIIDGSSGASTAITATTSAEVYISKNSGNSYESASPASGTLIIPFQMQETGKGTYAGIDANEIWYFAIDLLFGATYRGIVINITSAAGVGDNMRAGLYDVKAGLPNNLLAVCDTEIAIDATGLTYFDFDGGTKWLNAGTYFMGLNADGDPTLDAGASDSVGCHILGSVGTSGQGYSALYKGHTYAAMPNPADITSLTSLSGAVPPHVALEVA